MIDLIIDAQQDLGWLQQLNQADHLRVDPRVAAGGSKKMVKLYAIYHVL